MDMNNHLLWLCRPQEKEFNDCVFNKLVGCTVVSQPYIHIPFCAYIATKLLSNDLLNHKIVYPTGPDETYSRRARRRDTRSFEGEPSVQAGTRPVEIEITHKLYQIVLFKKWSLSPLPASIAGTQMMSTFS